MAFFDFGGLASSVNNFVFGGTKEATSNVDLEPAILDDILGFNFDAKSEMMDLFNNPSVSSSDDFLDKLITELDKEQDQDGKKSAATTTVSSFHQPSADFDFLPYNNYVETELYNKSSVNAWNGPSTGDTFFYPADALPAAAASQSSVVPPNVTVKRTDHLKNITATKEDNNTQCQGQDFFYETSLPHLAETVEVEFSHEHSYATSQHGGQNKRSFSSRNAACVSPCSSSSATTLNRPTRNSSLSQSSDSTNNDSFTNNNNNNAECTPGKIGKGAGLKYQDAKKIVGNTSSFVDYDNEEDVDDGDDSDAYSACSPDNIVYNHHQSAANYYYGKSSNKRYSGRQQYILPYSQSDTHRRDEKYPFLILSDEERQLCEKEGVKLPVKFPLTKQEERELRRIRRKIRNKRSAQESRRKKHEYITALEDRIKACDKNNMALRRHVEVLSRSNKTLEEQLKKLQSAVNNGTAKPAVQAGTCLAVLLLSFALLVAPNYDPLAGKKGNKLNGSQFSKSGKGKANTEDGRSVTGKLTVGSANRLSLTPGNTRTLQAEDDYETLSANNDVDDASSLSSFYDGSTTTTTTNWSSSSPRAAAGRRGDAAGFGHLAADGDEHLFDPSVLVDDGGGGGGTFNWTPSSEAGRRNQAFYDWSSSYTDNNKSTNLNTVVKQEWPTDAMMNDFTIGEPLIKRAKRCIESDTKPMIYQYTDGKYASGPILTYAAVNNLEQAQNKVNGNGTMNVQLLVNRRTVKAEEF